MFFLTYLRRELRQRMRQAVVIAAGLGLGIGLVITVTALSSGVRTAEGKVLGSLYGVGTDITVTTPVQPASGANGSGGYGGFTPGSNVQHSDILTSPTQGPIASSAVTAISRLHDVAAASGGLTLTEIKATLPGVNQPLSGSFQPPVQLSVVGAQVGRGALGPLNAAHRKSGREFTAADVNADVAVLDSGYATAHRLAVGSVVTIANNPFTVIGIVTQPQGSSPPSIYIPLKRAQALANLGAGKVNTVYVEAASAAAVGTVSREISRQMPSATVTNSGTLAKSVAGSLATTSKLATTFGTWLAVLALLAAFAVASLLTLAAVARRVREFGTLKALGWRSSRINLQVMGETIAMGIAGAALGVAIGFTGALLASKAAPRLTATVSTYNTNTKGGFGGQLGAGGGIFSGTIGGPMTTFANPNATHQVPVPFSAPVTDGAIVLAVALSLGGALVAGSFGGWRVTRLRPAEALASVG